MKNRTVMLAKWCINGSAQNKIQECQRKNFVLFVVLYLKLIEWSGEKIPVIPFLNGVTNDKAKIH